MKQTLTFLIIVLFAVSMLSADLNVTAQSNLEINVENTRDEDPPVSFTAELQDYNKAALAWMAPGSASFLWDQTDPEGETYGMSAQDFETAMNAYDCEISGDFILDQQCEITGAVFMFFFGDPDYSEPVEFNVGIYPDLGGYPSEDAIHTTGTNLVTAGETTVDFMVDFNDPVTLDAGTYWIGFNVPLAYGTAENRSYAYQKASEVNETPAYWRNPGGGFDGGSTTWADLVASQAGQPEDVTFAVLGLPTGATRDFVGYNVFRNGTVVNETTITTESYLDEGLTAGTQEYYVVAVYDEGNSAPTQTISLDVQLNAPQNLSCIVAGFNVVCSWQAPATTRDISYYVYRDDIMVAERASTQYVDLNPPAGDHTYYVTALYSGDIESAHSNEVPISIGTGSDDDSIVPVNTSFNSIYPNPFNPTTNLYYSVSTAGNVNLSVYNLKGQLISTLVNGHQEAGNYTTLWNGTDDNGKMVPSGIYLTKFESGDYTSTKKMILMK